jgi:hypothetical protein
MKQISKLISTKIHYSNKSVNGKIVSVSSYFDYNTDMFFLQELIKQNTIKIVKPLAHISFLKENQDSEFWKEGFNYELEIKPFGLLNIWGVHHINVVSIDKQKTEIITIEKNNICKVWDHKLTFKKISENETQYTDEVTLYAGWLTGILSYFLIYSYRKRHQNWGKLLEGQ